MTETVTMDKIVAFCKRRGFVYQSSEIYGGIRSSYDYGPLGIEMKRNIKEEWWRRTVHMRDDVVGLDAAIIMHPKVWVASGHLSGFNDMLVESRSSKRRYRDGGRGPLPREAYGDHRPRRADKGPGGRRTGLRSRKTL